MALTRTQVGQIDWFVPGASPEWVMGNDETPSPAEPLGATIKRIRQKLNGDDMVQLGIVRVIDGKLTRFYSDPQRADAMYQKPPLATHYEPQQQLPLELRDKEYWTFVVTGTP